MRFVLPRGTSAFSRVEPTILIVVVSEAGALFDVVVARAPLSDDVARVHAWWQRFNAIALGRPAPSVPVFFLRLAYGLVTDLLAVLDCGLTIDG